MKFSVLAVMFAALVVSACGNAGALENQTVDVQNDKTDRVEALPIFPGISNVDLYLPMLEGKSVAIVDALVSFARCFAKARAASGVS